MKNLQKMAFGEKLGKFVFKGTEEPDPKLKLEVKHQWVKEQLKELGEDLTDNISAEECISILQKFSNASFQTKYKTNEDGNLQRGSDGKPIEKENPPKETPLNSAQAIIAIQAGLKHLGINSGVIDGVYGRNTNKALKEFQRKVFKEDETEWDGIPGPKTIGKLIEALEDSTTTKVALSHSSIEKESGAEMQKFNNQDLAQRIKGSLMTSADYTVNWDKNTFFLRDGKIQINQKINHGLFDLVPDEAVLKLKEDEDVNQVLEYLKSNKEEIRVEFDKLK